MAIMAILAATAVLHLKIHFPPSKSFSLVKLRFVQSFSLLWDSDKELDQKQGPKRQYVSPVQK